MKKKRLPIGQSDFGKLIAGGYYYVDKTGFIRDVIEASAEVLLLPRPRRFGKTLNLGMLRFFFEKSDRDAKHLFRGLEIWDDECFDIHQGKYPAVWLTFKDIRETSWDNCFHRMKRLIQSEFQRHDYLLQSGLLKKNESLFLESVIAGNAEPPDYADSLLLLTRYLERFHNRPVVVLIDEYDTPLHSGYHQGYYEDVVRFMRNFLSGGLKDNPCLFKGVLTGILRIAKESIFSGLNNLGVYTVLDEKFSDSFGFTESETLKTLEFYDMADHGHNVSNWYNGYLIGKSVIYNPWSLLNYIDNNGKPKPYWINTGDMSMIDRLATRGGKEIREEIGGLLEGRALRLPVYETIVMRDLEFREDLLWSFLLFSGYLKPARQVDEETWELGIPNREVRMAYRSLVKTWFANKVEGNCIADMLRALSDGNVELFERLLRKIVGQIMSYHDFGDEPEKVYHALVLGMLVWMSGEYDIRSNRESGYGRYDIMLKPKKTGGIGIVIEFKRVGKKEADAHEAVLADALKQIEDRGYAIELESGGIDDILTIAVAFRGKRLWVKSATSRP